MYRDDAQAKLLEYRDELRAMGVRSLALFGSLARDEAGSTSDVDLLVEVDEPMGLLSLIAVQHRLEEILGAEVDLVTRSGVHPALRERILAEAVDVP